MKDFDFVMGGIFDAHAHYDDRRFDEDRYTLLDELFSSGKLYAAGLTGDGL